VRELLHWNRRINLTGHRDEAGVRADLIADGLDLVPHVRGRVLLDIGSGAGFPGLVLALAMPELEVALLESREKRVAFLHHMIGRLELGGRVTAVRGRASANRSEDPPELAERSFGTVTLRAVAGLAESLALARPYVAPGGRVLLPRGPGDKDEAMKMGLDVSSFQLDGIGSRLVVVLDT